MHSTPGMSLNFKAIFLQTTCASSAQNMADDFLLQEITGTEGCIFVRTYQWTDPKPITFGRYQKSSELDTDALQTNPVRRPTGGGCVFHEHDSLTWSLCIPRQIIRTDRVDQLFAKCQKSIQKSLEKLFKLKSNLAHTPEQRPENCFKQPVNNDLLDESGQKLSGIALHRSKSAILIQGSIQLGKTVFNDKQSEHLLQSLCLDVTAMPVETTQEVSTIIKPQEREQKRQQFAHLDWLHNRP